LNRSHRATFIYLGIFLPILHTLLDQKFYLLYLLLSSSRYILVYCCIGIRVGKQSNRSVLSPPSLCRSNRLVTCTKFFDRARVVSIQWHMIPWPSSRGSPPFGRRIASYADSRGNSSVQSSRNSFLRYPSISRPQGPG
jgi:hypothetical protein